jgi:hypothetical protein
VTFKPKLWTLLSLILGICVSEGCRVERPTVVTIDDGATPVFHLSGSGKLSSFSVYLVPPHPEAMDKPFSEQIPIWQITALPDFLHGRTVEEIRSLTYGSIPSGYRQSFPGDGTPPPPISPDDGNPTFFICDTTDAPPTSGSFRILDGKAIPATVRTPCWTTKNGKWIAAPCVD